MNDYFFAKIVCFGQIHKGTINWFGKASRISDIQHIDILITRKVRLVEEQLAYGDVFNLIL